MPRPAGKRFAILHGAYRILLRSYPASFRESHGAEMSRVFRQDCQEAWRRRGRLGVFLLSISTLVDLIRTAAAERLDSLHARNSRRRTLEPATRSVQEMIADLLQDLRYGARSMLSRPAFTAVAVLTLAVGIGTNTAIFGVVDGALLRPLPYREPDRLLMLWQAKLQWGLTQLPTSLPQLLDWKQRGGPFEEMAGFSDRNVALTGRGDPEQLPGARATSDLFQVLGVEPLLGRTFLPEESQPDSAPVVVIGEELWRRLFHSDPAALGQSLVIDGAAHTIIGVVPRTLQLPEEDTALWMPIVPDARTLTRDTRFLSVVARLRPTNTIDEAQAFMDEVGRQEAVADPENSEGFSMRVVSLREQISGPIRSVLLLFMAAVGLVLLIACVNVANLLLSRGVARQRELAIRGAVGASRGRIIQQLLTESTLLAVCGGVLGILLAQWGQNLLWASEPGNLPRVARVGMDARVLGFTALVCGATVLLYGLLPSLQVTGRSSGLVAGSTRGSSVMQGHRRIQRFLVVTEVALALMLSIGAALLLRTVVSVQSVSLGFEPHGVLTARVALPSSRYPAAPDARGFYTRCVERIAAQSGVGSAAVAADLPLTGYSIGSVEIEGRPVAQEAAPKVEMNWVSPEYFAVMSLPLLQGVDTEVKRALAEGTGVVISRIAAEQFWPGTENPIGHRVRIGGKETAWVTVAGIVGDERHKSLTEEIGPKVYLPISRLEGFRARRAVLVVRAESGDPMTLVSALRREVWGIDSALPITEVQSLDRVVWNSSAEERFRALVLGLFAGVGLLLAMVGIYAVMAYAVVQRTKEIGVRMSLGARRVDVLRLVVGEALVLAAVGVGIGLVASTALMRTLSSLLFGVSATDPATFAGAALVLGAVAVLAALGPAIRASRVDPIAALRFE